ncbi:hypothetical protein [Nocardioides guangzhouensis]|nr:hypothetical protein [Nocardioides guangzhouensis]
MSLTSLTIVAAEAAGTSDVNPWAVGAVVLGILLVLMLVLLIVGAGREHS